MKTNFPKGFDIEAVIQAIIDDEPDLVAERNNLIEALNQTKAGIFARTTEILDTAQVRHKARPLRACALPCYAPAPCESRRRAWA